MNQNKREALCDMGYEDSIVFEAPDYDDAIVGVTDEGQVVYAYDLMVECLVKGGMSVDDAIEFIDYNTIRALPYAGENPPIIMNRILDYDTESQ